MTARIDKAWFAARFAERGMSLRAVARQMGLDASALSRAMNGRRQLKLEEASRLATILHLPVNDVLAHATGAGFSEPPQAPYDAGAQRGSVSKPVDTHARHSGWGALKGTTIVAPGVDLTQPTGWDDVARPAPKSALFGCMKGTTIVMPGVDITQPADPDWAKVYDD